MTVTIRPMTADDIPALDQVVAPAFADLDRSLGIEPQPNTHEMRARMAMRHRHFLDNDPAGSLVAEQGGQVVGVAEALRRGDLWGLSLLAVAPEAQGAGVGKALLDATLDYAAGAGRRIILCSEDHRAARRYLRAGLRLHPAIAVRGHVDPAAVPEEQPDVRRGGEPADLALADAVDVDLRGAPHGPDHPLLSRLYGMYVAETATGRGYAYPGPRGGVLLLGATDPETARALLRAVIRDDALHGVESRLDNVTGEQDWAIETAAAAGLQLRLGGPVFCQGMTPPAPYLPSGAYL